MRNSVLLLHLLPCIWAKRWMRCPLYEKFTAAAPPFALFLGEKVEEMAAKREIHRYCSTFCLVFGQKGGRDVHYMRNSPLLLHLLPCFWAKRWKRCPTYEKLTAAAAPFALFLGKKVDEMSFLII